MSGLLSDPLASHFHLLGVEVAVVGLEAILKLGDVCLLGAVGSCNLKVALVSLHQGLVARTREVQRAEASDLQAFLNPQDCLGCGLDLVAIP